MKNNIYYVNIKKANNHDIVFLLEQNGGINIKKNEFIHINQKKAVKLYNYSLKYYKIIMSNHVR